MDSKDLLLEDAVLDGIHEGYDIVESPLSRRMFAVFGACVILFCLFFLSRTAYIGFFKKDQYENRAYANAGQEIVLRAPRGIIYDRYGKALVKNEPSFNVSLNLSELFKNKERIQDTLHALQYIVPFDVAAAYEGILKTDLERQSYYSVAQNVPLQQVIDLKKANISGVIIEDGYARTYPDAETFSHVLGYTGLASRGELEGDDTLDLNDETGKAGIEYVYDAYLRGTNGSRIFFRDANNNALGEKVEQLPISGAAVHTTIDADLQKVFFSSLADRLRSLGRVGGAGIALDPQTGEVLALVSLPSFDSNNLTGALFQDTNKPTFNRAISGAYSPGSTIKPLVAFAALEEQVVDPMTSVYSAGFIELPNPYTPSQPSRFVDWKAHGWVNLYSALARSSNVYFYEVGGGFEQQKGLGIERLRAYWEKFLLGEKTGIDLPGEVEGYLPDPESKEKRTGQIWRVGDTYNVSIGQGDLLVSPLSLLRYIGGIATKGKLFEPHVVSRIEKEKGNPLFENSRPFELIEQKSFQSLEEVETGMLHGVSEEYGTSHMLSSIPMKIAGKTGSAQIQNNQKTNAFFVGYNVPSAAYTKDDGKGNSIPQQIAILVLIEDAKEGSLNAVPVAQDVFQWYYEHRVRDEAPQER